MIMVAFYDYLEFCRTSTFDTISPSFVVYIDIIEDHAMVDRVPLFGRGKTKPTLVHVEH